MTKLICTDPWPPTSAVDPAVVTCTASIASGRGVTLAKNPSLDLLKLSLFVTPSKLMAMNDSGSPFTVELRLVVAVLTPGRNVTALIRLRVATGIRLSESAVSVDEMTFDCVLTISELETTFTTSVSSPTWRIALISAVVPIASRVSVANVLNPDSETLTVYVPGSSAGTENVPCPDVVVLNTRPVAVFLMVTVAPGTRPPSLSTATPLIVEVVPPCACAGSCESGRNTSVNTSPNRLRLIEAPWYRHATRVPAGGRGTWDEQVCAGYRAAGSRDSGGTNARANSVGRAKSVDPIEDDEDCEDDEESLLREELAGWSSFQRIGLLQDFMSSSSSIWSALLAGMQRDKEKPGRRCSPAGVCDLPRAPRPEPGAGLEVHAPDKLADTRAALLAL